MSASRQAEEAMLDRRQAELAAVRTELDTARAQVADLKKRLNQAEADHRADRATWWTERARLARLTRAAREWRRA